MPLGVRLADANGMLFDLGVPSIEGFRYQNEFITHEEERTLVAAIEQLPFGTVTFRGVEAKRRVVQFGWDYEFASRKTSIISGYLSPRSAFTTRTRSCGWAWNSAASRVRTPAAHRSRRARSSPSNRPKARLASPR